VQEGILIPFPNADLDVLVVWISMTAADTLKAVREAAEKFTDHRVTQFFDPQQIAGKAFAGSLGHNNKVAWDFYLFYPARSVWREMPPEPEAFMHQLPGSWANPNCLVERKSLKKKLNGTMNSLFS